MVELMGIRVVMALFADVGDVFREVCEERKSAHMKAAIATSLFQFTVTCVELARDSRCEHYRSDSATHLSCGVRSLRVKVTHELLGLSDPAMSQAHSGDIFQ